MKSVATPCMLLNEVKFGKNSRLQAGLTLIWGRNEEEILMIGSPAFHWGNRALKILTSTKNIMQ